MVRCLQCYKYREVGDGRNRRWENEGSAVASVVARARPAAAAAVGRGRWLAAGVASPLGLDTRQMISLHVRGL